METTTTAPATAKKRAVKKPAARRQSTHKPAKQQSNDRAPRLLKSAAAWLKRRGARREGAKVKQAYNQAASMISALAKK